MYAGARSRCSGGRTAGGGSGRRSGVRATPTFFVNGAIQDVSFGLEVLSRAVDGAEVTSGTRNVIRIEEA